MESQAVDESDDQFLARPGCCPHCGASFPSPTAAEVVAGVYSYAVDLGGGRAGVEGGVIFVGRCGACGTDLWAAGVGRREWAECDPAKVQWRRRCAPIRGG